MSIINSTSSSPGLHCEIWQPHQDFAESDHSPISLCQSQSSSSSSSSSEFFIDLYVSSYELHGHETLRTLRYKSFRQSRDLLTQDTLSSWSSISAMLSEIDVPYHLQPFFIQQISTRARTIAGEPNNALSQIIIIVVELTLPEEEGVEETQMSTGLCFAPASSLSIEKLERIKIVDNGSSCNCVICLDEISIGCDAVQMPCSHFYHSICILKWLKQSNLCPLCRFQMPLLADH